jgi:hypothetical protein
MWCHDIKSTEHYTGSEPVGKMNRVVMPMAELTKITAVFIVISELYK